LFKHVFPGVMPSLIVIYSIGVGGAIIGEATLSFLGLGVQPPTPSWGQMIADGQSYLTTAWWISVFPGLALAVVVIGITVMGGVRRDALAPRMRGQCGGRRATGRLAGPAGPCGRYAAPARGGRTAGPRRQAHAPGQARR